MHTTNCPQDSALGGADREGVWGIIMDINRADMVRTSLFARFMDIVP